MQIRAWLSTGAAIVAFVFASTSTAMAERIPDSSGRGEPLASGRLSVEEVHGMIHCQTVAELFVDPTLAPGSAPGGIVVTPNGYKLGAPREGQCARIFTVFTGQQP